MRAASISRLDRPSSGPNCFPVLSKMLSAITRDGRRRPFRICHAKGLLMPAALLSSVGDIALVSAPLTQKSRVEVCGGGNALPWQWAYAVCMEREPANYLRAWREFRKMSQDELADAVGTAKGVISLLENNKRPLSDKWLRKLAEALDTRPGHILDVDPNELDNDIVDIWTRIPERDREQAARVLRTFTKTGTDD